MSEIPNDAAQAGAAASEPVLLTDPLRPVSSGERVELLDILRGLALFGILAANIRGFAGPASAYFHPAAYWTALPDRIAQAFIDAFVQGKFIAIFAFLFGIGFAVQFERASARGGRFGWTYTRRLAILFLFGLVHGALIWWGDILLAYALIGFVLLAFRKRRDTTLLVWIAVCLAIPLLLLVLGYLASLGGASGENPLPPPAADELARVTALMANGSWNDIQAQRMKDVVTYNWSFFPMFSLQLLAYFLSGLYAWRKRLLTPDASRLPSYRRVMLYALAIGVSGQALLTAVRSVVELPMVPTTLGELALWTFATLAAPALSIGYICAVILLVHDPAWHARLHVFAAVGRTALTNYLLQSVVGTLIFYGYGLGFFGRIGPAWLLPLTVVLYAAQVAASRWWLDRYRFGPAEWLWRRLTYSGPLPMRAGDTGAAAP